MEPESAEDDARLLTAWCQLYVIALADDGSAMADALNEVETEHLVSNEKEFFASKAEDLMLKDAELLQLIVALTQRLSETLVKEDLLKAFYVLRRLEGVARLLPRASFHTTSTSRGRHVLVPPQKGAILRAIDKIRAIDGERVAIRPNDDQGVFGVLRLTYKWVKVPERHSIAICRNHSLNGLGEVDHLSIGICELAHSDMLHWEPGAADRGPAKLRRIRCLGTRAEFKDTLAYRVKHAIDYARANSVNILLFPELTLDSETLDLLQSCLKSGDDILPNVVIAGTRHADHEDTYPADCH